MSPDDTTSEIKTARTATPIRVADAGCGWTVGGTGTAQLVAGTSSLDSPLGRGGSATVSPTRRFRRSGQQGPAQRQPLAAVAVSQQPKTPNPHQSLGHDVQREPTHELPCVQRHFLAHQPLA